MFCAKRTGGGNTPNDNEPNETQDEKKARSEEEKARKEEEERLSRVEELTRRQALKTLNPDRYGEEKAKSYEVLAQAETVQQRLSFLHEKIELAQENMAKTKEMDKRRFGGEAIETEIQGYKENIETLQKNTTSQILPMKELELGRWEQGKMTPGEFIRRLEKYTQDMDAIDEMDASLKPKQRENLKKGRAVLLQDAKDAVESARKNLPHSLPFDSVKGDVSGEQEVWDLYTPKDKQEIIAKVSDAAGITAMLENVRDDLNAIEKNITDGKFEKEIETISRQVMDNIGMLKNPDADVQRIEAETNLKLSSFAEGAFSPLEALKGYSRSFNETFGIQWVQLRHIKKAFEELMESRKEVKKRKDQEKIASAALGLGHMTYWLPGMGGKELLRVLSEQQEKKKSEIKDAYKKELGDNRNDFGFKDLFGEFGEGGKLKDAAHAGDTNKTRAVLEFAAGKGLLFNIEGAKWQEYTFPGGFHIKDLVPREWNEHQVESYFGSLELDNNNGKSKSKKAGEDFVSGRGTADGYIEPFTGAINGLSVWFAWGIAEKAMSKVADGEMSTRLTLAITDAWENNPLFRKHVPKEWLDRVCGNGKQLLIGMTKYEKDVFVNGAKAGDTDLATVTDHAEENPKDTKLGKLVVATRNYLFKKDPDLEKMYKTEKGKRKVLLLQARLLASQLVELPNGKTATIYSQDLRPYHIKYLADMMRDAPVSELGDDFFIKRSEIIRGNAALMKAVGAKNTNGFAYPTKARYFFSHIITAEQELKDLAQTKGIDAAEKAEMQRAWQGFHADIRPHLDEYMESALVGSGADSLLTEQHKNQDGRPLFLTLAQKGLVSLEVIERIARESGGAAVSLLRSIAEDRRTPPDLKQRAQASALLFGGQGGKSGGGGGKRN